MTINSSSFLTFAETCEKVRETQGKLKKIQIVSDYYRLLALDEDLAVACTFLSGKIFPPGSKDLEINVGYSMLWKSISHFYSIDENRLAGYYRKHGDLGSAVDEYLATKRKESKFTSSLFPESDLTLHSAYQAFTELAKSTGKGSLERRQRIIEGLFAQVHKPLEAKYLVKIMTNEMRIGLVESLVEESIARCYAKNLTDVRNANLVTADIGNVVVLAKHDDLDSAVLELFRPTNFMLADSAPNAKALYEKLEGQPLISDYKYDGIRAQIHSANGKVKIFSRNLEDITRYFPEIEMAVKDIQGSHIMDGEIVPFKDGRPLSFQALQQRLRRLERSRNEAPIKYFAFDLLFSKRPLMNEKLSDRVKLLRSLGLSNILDYSVQRIVSSPEEIFAMFEESKNLGYEGLVVKNSSSPYSPGRRGKNWIKLKKELDTLDVVVVAAEYGHGKRAGVLSDYTFAVKDKGTLKVVGKAYSGLTNAEIKELTKSLKDDVVDDQGYRLLVNPKIVLEVAFDAVQESTRHDSGYALRFPRIKRIRTDKYVEQIDDLERVAKVYENQTVKF